MAVSVLLGELEAKMSGLMIELAISILVGAVVGAAAAVIGDAIKYKGFFWNA